MKRTAVLCLVLVLLISVFAGCGRSGELSGTGNAGTKDAAVQESSSVAPEPPSAENETEDSDKTEAGDEEQDSLTTNGGAVIPLSALEHRTDAEDAPVVYYISDITPEALMEIYDALEWTPTGRVAVKLSTGEPPASNYLRPELIKDLVQSVNGTIVECNTAYGGSVLEENYVGKAFGDYDSYLVLSHFKGHSMAGFGGAIKNISIGLGSSEGKAWIHSGGTSRTNPWGGEQDRFLEAMGDAGKAVSDYLSNGENIVYINVMNRLSIDCDCNGNPAEPDMHDIGILASADPVALDQACIDLVWVSEGNQSFINRVEDRNGLHTLENAEDIGLGSRTYQLIEIGK